MEIDFDAALEARIAERANQEGLHPTEFVRDVVAQYLDEETDSSPPSSAVRLRYNAPNTSRMSRWANVWIARHNPEAARRVASIIYNGCAQLKHFPKLGRLSRRMNGRRELTFAGLPYIAVYQLKEYALEISRIFHRAQDWP